jgi:hypothetical protein
MSAARPATLGATRTCPHCKATVLASASICPGCQHHLRFNASDARPARVGVPALQIEGTVRVPAEADTCEYCVVLSIGDGQGLQLARQVVNVGALQAQETRSFALSVELLPVRAPGAR